MLSILMPVYNERERVERAIAEVLDTPLPTQFELIVVDDGSTDGTRDILRNLVSTGHPTTEFVGSSIRRTGERGPRFRPRFRTRRANSPRSSTRISNTTRPISGC